MRRVLLLACAGMLMHTGAAHADRPVLVELFTSKYCAPCAPAEKIAARLARDPGILQLSFHVDYWNSPGAEDPYSSRAHTRRQLVYDGNLREAQVFTPQAIIDAGASVPGNREDALMDAIASARRDASSPAVVEIVRDEGGLAARVGGGPGARAEVWEFTFTEHHDVTRARKLGAWGEEERRYGLSPLSEGQGVAVVVQASNQGAILGAAFHE